MARHAVTYQRRGRAARIGVVAALAATGVVATAPANPVSAQAWQVRDLTASGIDADRLAEELAG